jgi:D-sedoheptulose 7-phosphate isomerase
MANPFITDYLSALRNVLDEIDMEAVDNVVNLLEEAYRQGRKTFIIGNGGSASTASHMQCDLAKGTAIAGKSRFRALSLTDNIAMMTAISNDVSFEKVFTDQLRILLEERDVVIGITASGNSSNILDAIRYAKEHGATTVGFIGFGGGKLKGIVDADVTVSSRNYGHCEDVHMILGHLISQCLRQKIEKA